MELQQLLLRTLGGGRDGAAVTHITSVTLEAHTHQQMHEISSKPSASKTGQSPCKWTGCPGTGSINGLVILFLLLFLHGD